MKSREKKSGGQRPDLFRAELLAARVTAHTTARSWHALVAESAYVNPEAAMRRMKGGYCRFMLGHPRQEHQGEHNLFDLITEGICYRNVDLSAVQEAGGHGRGRRPTEHLKQG